MLRRLAIGFTAAATIVGAVIGVLASCASADSGDGDYDWDAKPTRNITLRIYEDNSFTGPCGSLTIGVLDPHRYQIVVTTEDGQYKKTWNGSTTTNVINIDFPENNHGLINVAIYGPCCENCTTSDGAYYADGGYYPVCVTPQAGRPLWHGLESTQDHGAVEDQIPVYCGFLRCVCDC